MSFWGLSIRRKGGKNSEPLQMTAKQPPTLIQAIAEHKDQHAMSYKP